MNAIPPLPSAPEALAQQFLRYADAEYRQASPLYDYLARRIAADADLLALAAHAPPEQPIPHLFFAAIHFLLLQGYAHPLARFYPSLTSAPLALQQAFPALQDFCRAHADAIQRQLATRRNQTNEVGRCSYLTPAFTYISRLAGGRPLALVEIGASAGLNLMWDHYGYDYGAGGRCGDPESPVQLTCELRESRRPPLPERMPPVASKIGVEVNVIDLRDDHEALWLQALVWPEQRQRTAWLRHAIDVARRQPPRLLAGDGVALLPDILRAIPQDATLCVFHTHVINQFSAEARSRFTALLASYAATRDLYRLSAEWLRGAAPQLELTAWRHGQAQQRRLAYCHHHGQWLEWLDPDDA